LDGGTKVFAYDYLLFAHKDVPDDVVTKVLTALHEGEEGLKATSPLWREYDPALIGKSLGLDYHPAAEAFHQANSGG
jgi:TRAP-type uncharacterized transport system substrate-binding protein